MLDVNGLRIKLKKTDGATDLLAIVTIEDEDLSLRGFRVMKSKFQHPRCGEFLYVEPPTFGEKQQMAVYFPVKELWYQVEEKVIASYLDRNKENDSEFSESDIEWINKNVK